MASCLNIYSSLVCFGFMIYVGQYYFVVEISKSSTWQPPPIPKFRSRDPHSVPKSDFQRNLSINEPKRSPSSYVKTASKNDESKLYHIRGTQMKSEDDESPEWHCHPSSVIPVRHTPHQLTSPLTHSPTLLTPGDRIRAAKIARDSEHVRGVGYGCMARKGIQVPQGTIRPNRACGYCAQYELKNDWEKKSKHKKQTW